MTSSAARAIPYREPAMNIKRYPSIFDRRAAKRALAIWRVARRLEAMGYKIAYY